MSDGNGNGNGNGGMNQLLAGMPWWARFIVLIGPTTTMALFFAYRIDANHGETLARVETQLSSHANVTSAASAQLSGFVMDSRDETRTMIRLLQQLCVNTATDNTQRRECLQR